MSWIIALYLNRKRNSRHKAGRDFPKSTVVTNIVSLSCAVNVWWHVREHNRCAAWRGIICLICCASLKR